MTRQNVAMKDPRHPDWFYEEAIKALRTNLQFCGADIRTVMLTSCYPNEGKSDVTFQLAREFGKIGKKVLLLDADIRKSAYISRYQIRERITGLSQYLSGQARAEEIIYGTGFQGVDIIFAGPSAPNPSELLEQKRFASLMKELREVYDYVFIDTPPMGSVTDASVIAGQCDGAMLVIEAGAVSRHMAVRVKEQLELTGCRILGAVLNKVDIRTDRYYSKYGSYYRNDS